MLDFFDQRPLSSAPKKAGVDEGKIEPLITSTRFDNRLVVKARVISKIKYTDFGRYIFSIIGFNFLKNISTFAADVV